MSATSTDWTALQQAEDMACFKADLCCYSPESYSPEEKREICNGMASTSKAMLDAMRADFEQLPAEARSKLLDMLYQSGVEGPEWWWDVLVGEGDPLYRELEAILVLPVSAKCGVVRSLGPAMCCRTVVARLSTEGLPILPYMGFIIVFIGIMRTLESSHGPVTEEADR